MIPARWREAWIGWRNRRFADPRFQRWAADFPLTRGVARRRTRDLFDLVSGFVYSQALTACLRLGVLEILAAGPINTAALATKAGLSEAAAARLLGAAAALRLAESVGPGRWALGDQGAALLGNPGLSQMILHHDLLYADLADSVGLLRRRGGESQVAAFWPYDAVANPAGDAAPRADDYSRLMAATQPAVAADVLDAYRFDRHRRLLDVGGGHGAFLIAAAAQAPALQLSLFDLPAVSDAARVALNAAGLGARATVHAGTFLNDPLPTGADLITLIRILHDHDDAEVAHLLRAARAALPEDGALLIAEPMSGTRGQTRVADVYFAFYLLAMGRGRARSPGEITTLLHAAGFRRVRPLRTRSPQLLRALLAQP